MGTSTGFGSIPSSSMHYSPQLLCMGTIRIYALRLLPAIQSHKFSKPSHELCTTLCSYWPYPLFCSCLRVPSLASSEVFKKTGAGSLREVCEDMDHTFGNMPAHACLIAHVYLCWLCVSVRRCLVCTCVCLILCADLSLCSGKNSEAPLDPNMEHGWMLVYGGDKLNTDQPDLAVIAAYIKEKYKAF